MADMLTDGGWCTVDELDRERSSAYAVMACAVREKFRMSDVFDIGLACVHTEVLKRTFDYIGKNLRDINNPQTVLWSMNEVSRNTDPSVFHSYEIDAFRKADQVGGYDKVMDDLAKRLRNE